MKQDTTQTQLDDDSDGLPGGFDFSNAIRRLPGESIIEVSLRAKALAMKRKLEQDAEAIICQIEALRASSPEEYEQVLAKHAVDHEFTVVRRVLAGG